MPIGVRLKKSFDTRPKIFVRKAKEGAGDRHSGDRRKQGSRGNARGGRNEYPEDSSEPDRRERRWEDKSNSSFKGRSGSFDSGFARNDKKRFDDSRDFSEGRRSRAPNRRSFDSEEKHDREGASFDSRGRASGVRLSRERATNPRRRDVVFYESDMEETGDGAAREVRGRNHGGAGFSRKGDSNGRPRKYVDDESEGASDGAARAVRGGRTSGLRVSRERYADDRKRSFEDNEYDVDEIGDGAARAARGRRGRMEDNHGARDTHRSDKRGKDSYRTEERGSGVEEAANKFTSKGKNRDGLVSADKLKGGALVGLLEKHGNVKGKSDQVAEQKLDARKAKKVDKSGKGVDTPPRKRKRIKLDPYDISNKRMDDDSSNNENSEKAEENKIEISKNAQFRAIQPSPSILSFVEDNLVGRRRLIELQKAGYNIKLSAPLDNIPLSTSTERERIEENVFRNKLEFFAAAKISTSFPPPLIPEIAFAGRSNVGKSSLLNALTRQWGVVRTSDKPGLTQSINFFRLASKLCLVDLPGYGFAYAKEEVKDSWEELVKEYVSTRVGLQRVCLLIDTKWGMKPRDYELIDLMERSDTPYQIVLTKTDAVFPIDVARRAMQIQENLKANKSAVNPLMMVSSKSGAGIRSLRTVIAKLARFIKP